jgi:hypothetical protein
MGINGKPSGSSRSCEVRKKKVLWGEHDQNILYIYIKYMDLYLYIYIYVYIYEYFIMKPTKYCFKQGRGDDG